MEKKKQVSYSADLDLNKYEIRFWVEGNCMDAPEAPMRLKDGQRLKVHGLECDDGVFHIYRHIEEMRGKVCAIVSRQNGKRYCVVKEVVGLDELTGCLRLAFYNPKKTNVCLKMDAIERVYIVDGVEE